MGSACAMASMPQCIGNVCMCVMKKHRKASNTHRLCEEIRTYTNWIVPSEEEHVTRTMVISLFQRALCSKWPDARVYSFGSQDTQLYLPQGDIDLAVCQM